jgi:hypothetical protein
MRALAVRYRGGLGRKEGDAEGQAFVVRLCTPLLSGRTQPTA